MAVGRQSGDEVVAGTRPQTDLTSLDVAGAGNWMSGVARQRPVCRGPSTVQRGPLLRSLAPNDERDWAGRRSRRAQGALGRSLHSGRPDVSHESQQRATVTRAGHLAAVSQQ
jgi:hypothetical protein